MALTAKKVYAILKRQISNMEAKLNSPVRYRGTVAIADLLPLNPDIGDMYNIESKSVYGEAGMNVAWNGVVWDTMGAPIDMSLYLTKEEAETVIQRLVTEYFEKNPVKPGATEEQAQQIEQNKTDIASLKAETGSLKEDKLDKLQPFELGELSVGAVVVSNGNLDTTKTDYKSTDFVYCHGINKIVIKNTSKYQFGFVFCNEKKDSVVLGYRGDAHDYGELFTADVPKNAYYFRTCCKLSEYEKPEVYYTNIVDYVNTNLPDFEIDDFSITGEKITDAFIDLGIYMEKKAITSVNGSEVDNANAKCTDFIYCNGYKEIKLICMFTYNTGFAFYTKEKNFIAAYDGNHYTRGEVITAAVPSNAYYFRTTVNTVYYVDGKVWVTEFKDVLNKHLYNINNVPEKPLDNIKRDGGMCAIFQKIAVIGDSLSSGAHEYYDTSGTWHCDDIPNLSWIQFMGRSMGITAHNFSFGGATTTSWIAEFKNRLTEFKADAYFIAIGYNDKGNITMGTTADIDVSNYLLNANSFCGNYGQIIQRIKEVQPKARIFCITEPNSGSESTSRNQLNDAIRSVCAMFDYCYLIDLFENAPKYNTAFMSEYANGGHLNVLGYKLTADYIMTYTDFIIRNQYEDFREVAFIGTDKEYYSRKPN